MLLDLTKAAGILQGHSKTVKPGNVRYPFINGTKSFCFISTSRRRRNGIQRTKLHCVLSFCFVFAAMNLPARDVSLISIYLVQFLICPQIINQKQRLKSQKNN